MRHYGSFVAIETQLKHVIFRHLQVKRELSGLGVKLWLADWTMQNSAIFQPPTEAEVMFIGWMFKVAHCCNLIGQLKALLGQPVADPNLIAAAKCNGYTVGSEEEGKPNSAKIPVVCKQHDANCNNLDTFMGEIGSSF